jgi:hypothetical protein
MPKKKRKKEIERPRPLPATHDPGILTHDFFECLDLNKPSDVVEALDNLIYDLNSGFFLRWEAVICEEEGFPLTRKQKKALRELINFSDEWEEEEEERILYIDEEDLRRAQGMAVQPAHDVGFVQIQFAASWG